MPDVLGYWGQFRPLQRPRRVLTPDGPICLKIDVEGHETAVLEGAIGLLEGIQWVVQVETLEEVTAGVSSILADLGGNHAGRIGDDHYFVCG